VRDLRANPSLTRRVVVATVNGAQIDLPRASFCNTGATIDNGHWLFVVYTWVVGTFHVPSTKPTFSPFYKTTDGGRHAERACCFQNQLE
jgi:hypothetical protein